MNYWIFKVSTQELYPDSPGTLYVYDNTHSVKVSAGDPFLYLDKTNGYAFTGTGTVRRLSKRAPTSKEAGRTAKVREVYTAHLTDVLWFTSPVSIAATTKAGRQNRAFLGIHDANLLGWSQSIPRISQDMYDAVLGLAGHLRVIPTEAIVDYSVPDGVGRSKSRPIMEAWKNEVASRCLFTCVVCGSTQSEVLDAAHLSAWAGDPSNRANPANGLCLCAFCHRALDRGLIAISGDGKVKISESVTDPIALHHFTQLTSSERKRLLFGADPALLERASIPYRERRKST